MSFKLNNAGALTKMYGGALKQLEGTSWYVNATCCGCSGDCGSNWMRS